MPHGVILHAPSSTRCVRPRTWSPSPPPPCLPSASRQPGSCPELAPWCSPEAPRRRCSPRPRRGLSPSRASSRRRPPAARGIPQARGAVGSRRARRRVVGLAAWAEVASCGRSCWSSADARAERSQRRRSRPSGGNLPSRTRMRPLRSCTTSCSYGRHPGTTRPVLAPYFRGNSSRFVLLASAIAMAENGLSSRTLKCCGRANPVTAAPHADLR
mmetsp:Transcript_9791/g.30467  ORF Transcript_9791/g.30467 Transcript_9791/m.30467 type:complete len:214 (-) Transcript_9791:36-677(-)